MNNLTSTLTRAEALQLIDDAFSGPNREANIRLIALAWLGSERIDEPLWEVYETLSFHIDAVCLTDDVRSRGPRDDDDTGLAVPS